MKPKPRQHQNLKFAARGVGDNALRTNSLQSGILIYCAIIEEQYIDEQSRSQESQPQATRSLDHALSISLAFENDRDEDGNHAAGGVSADSARPAQRRTSR